MTHGRVSSWKDALEVMYNLPNSLPNDPNCRTRRGRARRRPRPSRKRAWRELPRPPRKPHRAATFRSVFSLCVLSRKMEGSAASRCRKRDGYETFVDWDDCTCFRKPNTQTRSSGPRSAASWTRCGMNLLCSFLCPVPRLRLTPTLPCRWRPSRPRAWTRLPALPSEESRGRKRRRQAAEPKTKRRKKKTSRWSARRVARRYRTTGSTVPRYTNGSNVWGLRYLFPP